MEAELQEEKKALNDKLKEQERKIVNLSTMVISSAADDFNQPSQKVSRHLSREPHMHTDYLMSLSSDQGISTL